MQGGCRASSWSVHVIITLLVVLQLHNMVGVVGTQLTTYELFHENCLKVWIEGIICLRMLRLSLACGFSLYWVSHLLRPLSPQKKKEETERMRHNGIA
jgi:uncharacterized membrane protein SpoIIM required for sporulation